MDSLKPHPLNNQNPSIKGDKSFLLRLPYPGNKNMVTIHQNNHSTGIGKKRFEKKVCLSLSVFLTPSTLTKLRILRFAVLDTLNF